MKTAKYDELQLANRYRIAFQTLIITFLMIMINGFVKHSYGVWAYPMLETLVMVIIPATFFTVMSIAKNAYLRQTDQPIVYIVLMGLAAIIGGAAVVSNITSGMFVLIEDGQLTHQIASLLITLFTGSASVTLLIRRFKNKRILENDE